MRGRGWSYLLTFLLFFLKPEIYSTSSFNLAKDNYKVNNFL